MKRNILNLDKISFPLLCLLAGGLFFLPACKKNNDFTGTPVVTQVRLLDPATKDSTFTSALPGTMVLVEGQNLGGITNIYFNDLDVYFNPTYNTNTNVIVTIPSNTPTEATNPDIPNTIRIVTTHGETSYTFIITIPPPIINAISNENALPGDSLIIYGSNLWLIEKVAFPGGKEVTDVATNADGTRLGMLMPDIGNDTGRLIIYAKYGTTPSAGPLNDHESSNVISNLTATWQSGEASVFNWSWWGASQTDDASLYPGTRGGYLRNNFDGVGANDGGWWNGNRSGNFDPVSLFTGNVSSQPAANYALKFEVNTKLPWTAAIDVLRFGETYAYRYIPWAASADKVFDTKNQWQTVTVPLNEFKKAENGVEGTGAGATTVGDVLSDGKVAFTYRFITEADPVANFDAAFDNFRIVKIK